MSGERCAERAGSGPGAGGLRWRRGIALAGFGAAAAYFLLTEHLAHTVQVLPWAILLFCPLMHLFLHAKHGGRRSGAGDGPPDPGAPR